MRETWFVLEDGTAVPPSEVAVNDKGRLAHKSGLVAMRDDGETPRSRGVDVDEKSGKRPFGGKGDHDENDSIGGAAPALNTEMRPEAPKIAAPKKPYKTRESKTK